MSCNESFADALLSVFDNEDRVLLLLEDDVRGEEGPRGLQLIATCLCARETNEVDVREDNRPVQTAGRQRQHAHLAEVEAQIHELKRGHPTHFVMAFHVADANAWKLAWSEDTDESEAVDELITFVKCGMIYDY